MMTTVGLTLAIPVVGVAQGVPPTADQVIAANIAARGGLARVTSVRSETLTGHITFADGVAHPLLVHLARPNRVRTEITLDGGRIVQAYDGRVAWAMNTASTQGDTAAQVLPLDQTQNIAAGADMDGPLTHHAEKGNRVTLAGIDTADGRPAYKLNVVTASGLADTYYIDTTSHLQTKWQGHRTMNAKPVVFESYFRDYRPVNGVMFAFTIASGIEGEAGGQTITLDSVQLDKVMPDSDFTMPKRSVAPAPRGE
jgi:hypothetical protein